MSKCTCICNTVNMYMLQLSLFTACSLLKKKYRKKIRYTNEMCCNKRILNWDILFFFHKSQKRLILDPLKRNKKQLHLSSNISASRPAFKHRISSSINDWVFTEGWCMTELCHSVTFSYVHFSHISFSWITELHPVESD